MNPIRKHYEEGACHVELDVPMSDGTTSIGKLIAWRDGRGGVVEIVRLPTHISARNADDIAELFRAAASEARS